MGTFTQYKHNNITVQFTWYIEAENDHLHISNEKAWDDEGNVITDKELINSIIDEAFNNLIYD